MTLRGIYEYNAKSLTVHRSDIKNLSAEGHASRQSRPQISEPPRVLLHKDLIQRAAIQLDIRAI
jgi:hypothetical protein